MSFGVRFKPTQTHLLNIYIALHCVLSSYGLEGPGTTCSVQWQQRSLTTRSYVGCLFVFCLLLPLLLMVFCYGRIDLTKKAI